MLKNNRNVLEFMHTQAECMKDFWAERSARRALAKLLIDESMLSNRRVAKAFFARCCRFAGEAEILEAVYKLGNPENHLKYEAFLKKYGRKIKFLYHACFSE